MRERSCWDGAYRQGVLGRTKNRRRSRAAEGGVHGRGCSYSREGRPHAIRVVRGYGSLSGVPMAGCWSTRKTGERRIAAFRSRCTPFVGSNDIFSRSVDSRRLHCFRARTESVANKMVNLHDGWPAIGCCRGLKRRSHRRLAPGAPRSVQKYASSINNDTQRLTIAPNNPLSPCFVPIGTFIHGQDLP